MRVLYITTPHRTGAWLAEAFAGDSACQVILEEAQGAADGLAAMRDRVFDAVLVSHESAQLDALELVDGLRAGGAEEPLVILGQASEQEMAALAFEVGADAYVCVNTATTRTLLWIVARATERHSLIRDHRRLAQAERQRREHDQRDTERLLTGQRGIGREAGLDLVVGDDETTEPTSADSGSALAAIGRRAAGSVPAAALDESIKAHYHELLRAHVIMGSGNLSSEMSSLAEHLAARGVTAPQAMQLHVQVVEELVRGLGGRSARHVMTRADLVMLEILVHLAECYRLRCQNLAG